MSEIKRDVSLNDGRKAIVYSTYHKVEKNDNWSAKLFVHDNERLNKIKKEALSSLKVPAFLLFLVLALNSVTVLFVSSGKMFTNGDLAEDMKLAGGFCMLIWVVTAIFILLALLFGSASETLSDIKLALSKSARFERDYSWNSETYIFNTILNRSSENEPVDYYRFSDMFLGYVRDLSDTELTKLVEHSMKAYDLLDRIQKVEAVLAKNAGLEKLRNELSDKLSALKSEHKELQKINSDYYKKIVESKSSMSDDQVSEEIVELLSAS